MTKRLDIQPNDVAERERIERFELDAEVVLQMKRELAEERRLPVEDIWFMGLRDIDGMEWDNRPDVQPCCRLSPTGATDV